MAYTHKHFLYKILIPISRQGLLVTSASFSPLSYGEESSHRRGDLGPCGMQRCLGSGLSQQEVPCSSCPLNPQEPTTSPKMFKMKKKRQYSWFCKRYELSKMPSFSYHLKIFGYILAFEYKIDNIGLYQGVPHSQKTFHLWFETFLMDHLFGGCCSSGTSRLGPCSWGCWWQRNHP